MTRLPLGATVIAARLGVGEGMDLRRLRYFVAVAEESNFTRAAARLHMAQPPLSRQIMELERELGAPLFVRSPRALRLTEAGEVLLGAGRELLAQADEAREAVQRAARGETGELRVGFVTGIADDFLPAALSRFRMLAAGVAVELRELATAAQVDALFDGRLDVGVVYKTFADRRIEMERLRSHPIWVVLPSGHALVDHETVSVADLANETLILGPEGLAAPFARPVVDEGKALGIGLRADRQVADRKSIAMLVASGLGVTIIAGRASRLSRPGLVTRPLVGRAPLLSETVAAWRHDRTSLLVSRFVEALVVACADTEQVS